MSYSNTANAPDASPNFPHNSTPPSSPSRSTLGAQRIARATALACAAYTEIPSWRESLTADPDPECFAQAYQSLTRPDHFRMLGHTWTVADGWHAWLGNNRAAVVEKVRAFAREDGEWTAPLSHERLAELAGVSLRSIQRYLRPNVPSIAEAMADVAAQQEENAARLARGERRQKLRLGNLRDALLRLFILDASPLKIWDEGEARWRMWKNRYRVARVDPVLPQDEERFRELLEHPANPPGESLHAPPLWRAEEDPCSAKMTALPLDVRKVEDSFSAPPGDRPAPIRRRTPEETRLREVIGRTVRDYGASCHDQAPESSITRCVRLFLGAGLTDTQCLTALRQAREAVYASTNALVRRDANGAALLMPTFFRKLQMLCGGANNPAYIPEPSERAPGDGAGGDVGEMPKRKNAPRKRGRRSGSRSSGTIERNSTRRSR